MVRGVGNAWTFIALANKHTPPFDFDLVLALDPSGQWHEKRSHLCVGLSAFDVSLVKLAPGEAPPPDAINAPGFALASAKDAAQIEAALRVQGFTRTTLELPRPAFLVSR